MRLVAFVLMLLCGSALAQVPDVGVMADASAPVSDVGVVVTGPDAAPVVPASDAGGIPDAAPASDASVVPAPDAGAVVVAPKLEAGVVDQGASGSDGGEVSDPDVGPVVPVPPDMSSGEIGQLLEDLVNAAKNGHWTVLGGLVILLIVWVFNRLGMAAKIGPKYVPWVALLVGGASAVALGLAQGQPLAASLKLGLLEGGVAVALWELIAKHFANSSKVV